MHPPTEKLLLCRMPPHWLTFRWTTALDVLQKYYVASTSHFLSCLEILQKRQNILFYTSSPIKDTEDNWFFFLFFLPTHYKWPEKQKSFCQLIFYLDTYQFLPFPRHWICSYKIRRLRFFFLNIFLVSRNSWGLKSNTWMGRIHSTWSSHSYVKLGEVNGREGFFFKVWRLFSASVHFFHVWQWCSMHLNPSQKTCWSFVYSSVFFFLPCLSSSVCHPHADFVIKEFFDFWTYLPFLLWCFSVAADLHTCWD